MVRTDDLIEYEISLSGNEIVFGRRERKLSHEEAMAVRVELRSRSAIPTNLIDLIDQFKEDQRVKIYMFRPTQKIELKLRIELSPDRR
jgi:hypothetical protein